MKNAKWCRWAALILVSAALAACGGGGDDGDDPAADTPVPPPSGQPAVRKMLLIGLDGATYDAVRAGTADGTLPNLAQLTLTRGWTGGVTATPTQQSTLDAPGWATLLTGGWADTHQVRSNAAGQALHADTLFKRLKTAQPAARTAAAFHTSVVAQIENGDRDAGYLSALTDCAGDDVCVARDAQARIGDGYDAVVAQFGAVQRAAQAGGFGGDYRAVLRQADAGLGGLLAAVAARRQAHPEEDWLVMVTASHGLSPAGASDGLPLAANKTLFIAANRAALLGADRAATDLSGAWDDAWYALPSAADVAPTALAHLRATGQQAGMAGAVLTDAVAVRRLAAVTAADNGSVALSWSLVGEVPAQIVVLRDGAEVARLPGDATHYQDSGFTFQEGGLHTLDYTVQAGASGSAVQAKVLYTPPVLLESSLRNGLTMLYTFENRLQDVSQGATGITPYDGAQGPEFADGPFGRMFRAQRTTDTLSSFKLDHPAGMLATPNAFTIGFWFRSDGMSDDKPVLTNKDYNTGANAGITIAQWNTTRPNYDPTHAEFRFNLGDGSRRVDINGLSYTANQPVYVALSIDKAARTMTAYVYDLQKGFATRSASTGSVDLSRIEGVIGAHLGMNEDALGNYNKLRSYDKRAYTMDFDDLAFWNRALTETEVRSLALSGHSVAEVLP
ncbi:LamG-like jellyroll fold domain-containing protein [Bordetella genomosp. 13]|uniref:LamG-like jellyroll fold domain-containing protein n=1 Tax=Bordetella genomosp. 13 TaxID=463040 RepID=UPI0011A80D79|nr:LamG-like jellyroll fold domain-containing protein [Bordetella genomosp. 13]